MTTGGLAERHNGPSGRQMSRANSSFERAASRSPIRPSGHCARIDDMNLAVSPPLPPMLAKRVTELPEGERLVFEPKWDGFRTIVFKDGAEVLLESRDAKPMNRYFPELVEPLAAALPE